MYHGLDDAPKGLKNLLLGKNNGKVIVRVQKSIEEKPSL